MCCCGAGGHVPDAADEQSAGDAGPQGTGRLGTTSAAHGIHAAHVRHLCQRCGSGPCACGNALARRCALLSCLAHLALNRHGSLVFNSTRICFEVFQVIARTNISAALSAARHYCGRRGYIVALHIEAYEMKSMPVPVPGGVRPAAPGGQLLPPPAPLQLGPLTPAAAAPAPGPGQPPFQSMTPNFWGVVPPGHVPQVPPPMWPHLNGGPGSGPAAVHQPPIAHSAGRGSVLAQQRVGAAVTGEGAASTSGSSQAAAAALAQDSVPASGSSLHSIQPQALAQDSGEAAPLSATVLPVAVEQQAPVGSTAPQEAIPAEQPPPSDAQQRESAEPAHVAAAADAGPATQELESAAAETRTGDALQPSNLEGAVTGIDVLETAPAASEPEQGDAGTEQEPEQAVSEEGVSASGQAMSTAKMDSAAAPADADTGSAAPSGQQKAAPTAATSSEAPALAGSDTEQQRSLPGPPADKSQQPDPDSQSKLAADAGAALIGVVREEPTSGPGEGHVEQSQLAANAGAALVGDIRAAASCEHASEPVSTLPAETPAQPSEPHDTDAALPSGHGQEAAPDANGSSAEQLGNPPMTDLTPQPGKPTSQRLFDPTAVLSNGFVSPASDAITPPSKGLVDPMRSAVPRPSALPAAVPPPLPAAAQDVEADADEAELWGSLLVDSPSPCKAAKVVWTQDAGLWRPNGSGPAPPSLGQ